MSEENTKVTKKYYDNVSVGNRTRQTAYFVQQHDKNKMFLELLKTLTGKQILMLVKSKRTADNLMEFLKEKEIQSCSVHGNHRASQIEEATLAFNSKKIAILITTDRILETLSLSDIQTVINYDLPLDASDYFKRLILVDEIGESISLVDPEDEKVLAVIEHMMKCEIAEVEIENFEHTPHIPVPKQDKTKKPRHKKVQRQAKRKAEIKSKWIPTGEEVS